MDQDILKIIEDQKNNEEFAYVKSTEKRLLSLDYSRQEVDEYLVWAYQKALREDGLNIQEYQYYLNRLPLQNENDALEHTKVLSLEQTLTLLQQLVSRQGSSLSDRSIRYLICEATLDDGYQFGLRLFDDIDVLELALLFANRESLTDENYDISLTQKGKAVDVKITLNNRELGDLLEEAGDELTFHYLDSHASFKLRLEDVEELTFAAIEEVQLNALL